MHSTEIALYVGLLRFLHKKSLQSHTEKVCVKKYKL